MKEVILQESDLWDSYEYHLKAEKYNNSVKFLTKRGEFVASFSRPTRASKGLPVTEVSAKFTQRFYKRENLVQPKSLKEMDLILKTKSENLAKGIL